ncbi:hypothetical protein BKA64DRAFT_699254 [Cadophora sp. MPI-SDFR-AT-0126]|nr:hypothetical protein BKA64DRAFT_699254 [Leotiomycetes sp. MPI-SDFR-AT-0126]
MSNISAYRRSPRSIERLCREEFLQNLTKAQSALVLSLACLSGWSAERIVLTIKKETSKEISAEDVWHYQWRCILLDLCNDPDFVSEENRELMKTIIKEAMIEMEIGNEPVRSLHRTVKPMTVSFVEKFSHRALPPVALCEGYTADAREASKACLITKSPKAYGKLTPVEEPVIARFGSTVEFIIKKILRHWFSEVKQLLNNGKPLQHINHRDQVQLIMRYIGIFHQAWEMKFGLMQPSEAHKGLQVSKTSDIYIASTGYGCKVLLGLMMADRIHRVTLEALDDNCKECFVCKNQMGIEDEDGIKEHPILLTICCDKSIGEDCMKKWCEAKGQGQHDCPFCRTKFTDRFWKKLFEQKGAGGISMRPKEMSLMMSRGQSTQALRSSELSSPLARLALSPSSIEPVNQTVSLPNNRQRIQSGDFLERWAEVARSRRLNRGRWPGSQDNFDSEG